MNRTLRRTIPESAPGMLFGRRRSSRGTTKKTGTPPAASSVVLITDRKSTGNSRSSEDLTKSLTVRRGERSERGATGSHQFTPQTTSLPITATFSPLRRLATLIRGLRTITDPQMRTTSPSLHTRSLERATVMPFRTDGASVKKDSWVSPRGRGL